MLRPRWLLVIGLLLQICVATGDGRASAHAPHPGLDFSMGADTNSDGVDDCSTRGGQPATCIAPQGGPFVVHEYLDALGDIPAFRAIQLHFGFEGGVQLTGIPQSVWPGCAKQSWAFYTDYAHANCRVGDNQPSVSYLGLIGKGYYVCDSDGSLSLMHGLLPYHTFLIDSSGVDHAEGQQTVEMLDVQCLAPQPYPVDSDGDGCPDSKEAGTNQMLGGKRNFLNRWDYFNPTGDGKNRIDDIIAVVQHFGKHQGNAGYDSKYDRTYVGPNLWNLGPPDGQISVADILAAVQQYNHDCS